MNRKVTIALILFFMLASCEAIAPEMPEQTCWAYAFESHTIGEHPVNVAVQLSGGTITEIIKGQAVRGAWEEIEQSCFPRAVTDFSDTDVVVVQIYHGQSRLISMQYELDGPEWEMVKWKIHDESWRDALESNMETTVPESLD